MGYARFTYTQHGTYRHYMAKQLRPLVNHVYSLLFSLRMREQKDII